MPNASKISPTLRSKRAHSWGVIVRPSSGSQRAGSSMMLKGYLPVQWSHEERGDYEQLDCEQPDESQGSTRGEAGAECGELGRQAEVGERPDLPELHRCARRQAIGESVLPAVEDGVGAT